MTNFCQLPFALVRNDKTNWITNDEFLPTALCSRQKWRDLLPFWMTKYALRQEPACLPHYGLLIELFTGRQAQGKNDEWIYDLRFTIYDFGIQFMWVLYFAIFLCSTLSLFLSINHGAFLVMLLSILRLLPIKYCLISALV